MAEPVKVCVIIEGGLVQQVLSAGVPVEVVIIDYDTEGADPNDLASIPQDGGGEADAFCRLAHVDNSAPAFVLQAFEIAEAMEREG